MAAGTYITLADYKSQTGVAIADATIQSALEYAKKQIRRCFFIKQTYRSRAASTDHFLIDEPFRTPFLKRYIGDFDGSGDLSADDINVFELDDDLNETDLTANISTFDTKYGKLVMDAEFPSDSDNEFRVEWYGGKFDNDQMALIFEEIATIYATNWLFTRVPYEKLQKGISSWTLNGVTVQFDQAVMAEVVKNNLALLKQYMFDYKPLYMAATTGQRPSMTSARRLRSTITFRSV